MADTGRATDRVPGSPRVSASRSHRAGPRGSASSDAAGASARPARPCPGHTARGASGNGCAQAAPHAPSSLPLPAPLSAPRAALHDRRRGGPATARVSQREEIAETRAPAGSDVAWLGQPSWRPPTFQGPDGDLANGASATGADHTGACPAVPASCARVQTARHTGSSGAPRGAPVFFCFFLRPREPQG